MFPNQSSSSGFFLFNFNNSSKNIETPISDIQSDKSSVNLNLCETFQGLLKKQDYEESTMSSQWFNKDNSIASAYNGYNDGQNLNKQNTQTSLKMKKIQSKKNKNSSTQGIKLQDSNSLKKFLLEKRNKIMMYRQKFLSSPAFVKLPIQLLKMVQIAEKIDKYLFSRKQALYMDNIHNIFNTLFCDEQMSTIWSTIKKILFINSEYYKIRIDPLKNVCLAFNDKKDTKLEARKQKLRQMLGEYYFNNKESYVEKGIPEVNVQPTKTSRFYPQNLNICPDIHQNKLNKRFIQKLELNALKKQNKLQELEEKCSSCAPPSTLQNEIVLPIVEQLSQFCDAICRIYNEKNVFHLYKATLIQQLRKSTIFSLERIFFLMKYIIGEELFLEVRMKSGCQILKLIESEKQSLIGIVKGKSNKKDQ